MLDIFADRNISLTSPLIGGFAITPADNLDLPMVSRQLRVTGKWRDYRPDLAERG